MRASEQLAVRAMIWGSAGAAAAVPMLVIPPSDDPLLPFVVHLAVVTLFVTSFVLHCAPVTDDAAWFAGTSLGAGGRWALAGIWTIVVVAGVAGVTSLATAAGLRFDPSLQFLSVLSSLDIAWVVAAATLGTRRRWGGRSAVIVAAAVATVCVWSIWRYLDAVGFTESGGWSVDGAEIARLVLPFDVMAAVVAIAIFSAGARSASAAR